MLFQLLAFIPISKAYGHDMIHEDGMRKRVCIGLELRLTTLFLLPLAIQWHECCFL